MKNIRQIAKTLSVDTGKLSKPELIRKIQLAEGNFDCYGSATNGTCDQQDCAWSEDCLSEATSQSAQAA
ncbi:hypothetical protein [Rhodoferax sp.]|uniref:hypothetical protein n=1 Tax=Rhodoferax sp. TaxID=50421 RepID=UPI0025EFCAC2|nr:hypothetical protein [Rhodoferax sp.]